MVEKAYTIIINAFSGKFDKAGEPYIFHLKRVAAQFSEDEHLFVIALLHDLLEDCPEWDYEQLIEQFPVGICNAVRDLTKKEGENYDDYLNRVSANNLARQVKLSDLKDNMNLTRFRRGLDERDLARAKKYHDAYLRLSHF